MVLKIALVAPMVSRAALPATTRSNAVTSTITLPRERPALGEMNLSLPRSGALSGGVEVWACEASVVASCKFAGVLGTVTLAFEALNVLSTCLLPGSGG